MMLMNEADLTRCEKLMTERDHASVLRPADALLTRAALADEVPGLVAEVRRLNLQVDAWRKAVLMFRVSSHSQVQNALDGIEQEVSKATGIPAEKLYEGLFVEKRKSECPKCGGDQYLQPCPECKQE